MKAQWQRSPTKNKKSSRNYFFLSKNLIIFSVLFIVCNSINGIEKNTLYFTKMRKNMHNENLSPPP